MKHPQKGFTLIEILIYAGLTTLIMSFAIMMVYQLLKANDQGRHQRELVENQKFLEQKIFWALQSVSAINYPGPNATSTSISINKVGYANNPVIIDDLASTTARIKIGAAAAQPITGDTIAVTELFFHQLSFSGQTAIEAAGTLTNLTASTSVSFDTIIVVK